MQRPFLLCIRKCRTYPGVITAPEGFSYGSIALNDYPYDEVWLTPRYTELWTADGDISVTLELDQPGSHAK